MSGDQHRWRAIFIVVKDLGVEIELWPDDVFIERDGDEFVTAVAFAVRPVTLAADGTPSYQGPQGRPRPDRPGALVDFGGVLHEKGSASFWTAGQTREGHEVASIEHHLALWRKILECGKPYLGAYWPIYRS